jgi:hypothetical protein
MVRAKILKMSMVREILNGDVQGDCRRYEKIAKKILAFLGG